MRSNGRKPPGCWESPWYVRAALRGTGRHHRRTRLRTAATGLAAVAVAALLAACGGESSSDSNERAGTYQLKVVDASFPSEQRLGQTSMLRLAVRNTGDETVPTVTVTIGVDDEEGRDSSLPFGIHDPQPGLAQADRPVWVLAESYPRFEGSSEPGGASTSNRKTFALGPLKPNQTATALWKLSAVKAGDWKVRLPDRRGTGDPGEGRDAGRRRARGHLPRRDHLRAAGNRSHRRRRSRRNRRRRIAITARGSRATMRRPSLAATVVAVLLASLALPACGAADSTSEGNAAGTGATASAGAWGRAEEDRAVRAAGLRHRRPRLPAAPVRRRATRADRGPAQRQAAPQALPGDRRHRPRRW